MFTRAEAHITQKEMNEVLRRFHGFPVEYVDELPENDLLDVVYIKDSIVNFAVTVRDPGAITYITRKDINETPVKTNGMIAFRELARSYRLATGEPFPEAQFEGSARALLAYRESTNNTRQHAIGYDMNSAYGWGLCQLMPDTREEPAEDREVQEGEIGFEVRVDNGLPDFSIKRSFSMKMAMPGEYAEVIFPVMESPFRDFAERWYDRKVNSKTEEEKKKAKAMLVYSVGYLQRKNPFLRCAVIEHCNKRIRRLIDKDTIYCNTDSLVSLSERKDLPISDRMGDFKVEHTGEFAYTNLNCQWNKDKPAYRGVPKAWFSKDYDILKDPVPTCRNAYSFNKEAFQLEEN